MSSPIPDSLLQRIRAVTNKRARFVLDRILHNGFVTNEEISQAGYNHPPRAARDVRELGIPLKTIKAKHSDGRSIAAYSLDLETSVVPKSGRLLIAKQRRVALFEAAGNECQICGANNNLQVDHRVPYEVAGESQNGEANPYQVLDGACNRKKSWTCEHCLNWREAKDPQVCNTCYWANPNDYTHVAMQQERRIDLRWSGDDIAAYDLLVEESKRAGEPIRNFFKGKLANSLKRTK